MFLAEGPWPSKAHADACRRERRRCRPRQLNYISSRAPIVSRGAYDQTPGGMIFSAEPEVINPGFEIPVQPGAGINLIEPIPAEELTPKGPERVPGADGPTAGTAAPGPAPK